MTSCSHYPESTSPLQLSFPPALLSSASPSLGSSASASASTMPSSTTNSSALSPPVPMGRPSSHSFSMERPPLPQDIKKSRNSKRLSLMVTPSPGKLEHLASIAAAATVVASSPSFPPSTPSFSSRRHFTSAPLSSLATIQSQSPATSPVATPITNAPVEESTPVTSSKRQSQLMLDQALPSPRLPLSSSTANAPPRQRPISAYFADFSAECGTASPYTKEPVCVLPHLYLGAEHNATDVNILARLGITAVLNVAIEISNASQQQYQVPASPTFLSTSSPTSASPEKMITVIGGDRIVKTPNGGSIHYKNLSWTHHQRNLLSEFPKAFAFIEDVKSMDGKVLIHCQLGVSRSASLVIAYVMKTLQMKLTDAYEFVKARSSVISPNMSLMYQLAEFGKSLERPLTSASSPRTGGGRRDDYDDDNYDDLEDGYPYPTDRTDLDGDVTMTVAKPERIPTNPTTPVRSTTTKRATLVLARPGTARLTVNRSPLAPVNVNAANGVTAIPKTPMTDRFSFSDNVVPSTPMADRFSSQGVHPLMMPPQHLEQQQQFPEGVSMPIDLSPPVPPFAAASHRVSSSSASSGSSFTTSATYSRPSSMSSAASSTMASICSGPSKVAPQPSVSVVVTPTPLTIEEEKESTNNGSNHLWTKLPATPTRTHSGMSVSSTSSSTSQKKQSKKAAIHALAKVLTRPWSRNGFHSCQNQQQQHSSSSLMTDVTTVESNQNDDKTTATESGSSEVIFSPRPGSSSPENNSFGDFCQALRME